ncbi:hypothetical protein CSB09_00865 [Candidatus Gracilibacteria bacterium]|nr:MAG: hypothetical protein CSB09_00865 [Candidatus Gracilibacteria bacterium]
MGGSRQSTIQYILSLFFYNGIWRHYIYFGSKIKKKIKNSNKKSPEIFEIERIYEKNTREISLFFIDS